MRTVRAPDGATWQIKRHWISRRPRWRGREGLEILDLADLFSFLDDTPVAPILGFILVIGLLLLFTGFLAFVVEIVVIVVAVALTMAAKVLFRRPWIVEAAAATGDRRRWAVVGWRRSGEIIEEIARAFETGTRFVSADARELDAPSPNTERADPTDKKRAAPKDGS